MFILFIKTLNFIPFISTFHIFILHLFKFVLTTKTLMRAVVMRTLKKISTTKTKKMKTKLSLMMMKKNKEMKMTLMRKPTRKVIVLVIQKF